MVLLHGRVALFSTGPFAGVSIDAPFGSFAGDATFLVAEIFPEHQIHGELCNFLEIVNSRAQFLKKIT